jgi:hypothetical protein
MVGRMKQKLLKTETDSKAKIPKKKQCQADYMEGRLTMTARDKGSHVSRDETCTNYWSNSHKGAVEKSR